VPFISEEGGSGGPEVASGALVSLQNNLAGYTGGFGNLALDTVEKDSDGYWNPAQNALGIPAGLGGLFVVTLYLQYAADALITFGECVLVPSGAAPNAYAPMQKDLLAGNRWAGTLTYVVYGAAGSQFNMEGDYSGPASVTVQAGTFASIARIGSMTGL